MEDLTPKQEKFVKEYLDSGNGTKAALEVYDTNNPRVAASIASENLTKPNIQKYLEDIAVKAATRVEQLMEQSENLTVALGASKDILDRAGYKPVDKSELSNPDGNLKTIIINKHASDDKLTS